MRAEIPPPAEKVCSRPQTRARHLPLDRRLQLAAADEHEPDLGVALGQQGGGGDEGGVILHGHHPSHDAHQGCGRRHTQLGPQLASQPFGGRERLQIETQGNHLEMLARRDLVLTGQLVGQARGRNDQAAGGERQQPFQRLVGPALELGRSTRAARGRERCAPAPEPGTGRPRPVR